VKIPVVAAGGIMDGAGIAAVLSLGAQAAQVGTAFIPCPESGAPTRTSARFSRRAKMTRASPKNSPASSRAGSRTLPARIRSEAFPADRVSGAERADREIAPGVGEGRQPGFLRALGGPGCTTGPCAACSRAHRAARAGNHRRNPQVASFVKE
jgi:nitronate monooxygenase